MSGIESFALSYLVNSVWQIPLLFAAGWTAARALRGAGAQAEHRVWVSVLLLEALLPAISTLPWEWLDAWLPWSTGTMGDGHVTVTMGAAHAASGFSLPAWLPATLALAYGAACAYFAARFVWQSAKLWSLRRETVLLEGQARERWTRCAATLGTADVSIAASTRVFGPVTMGLRRRLLLLPLSMAEDLPEAELCAVLTHEFAHLRRNDFVKNLLYELVTVPASYHPLMRATRERVTESREMICDAMAAGEQGRHAYARSLLRLASLLVEGAPVRTPHAIGIFDANTFERRLMRLTEKQAEMRGARRLATAMLCAALGAGACASAMALSVHVDAATASAAQDTPPQGGTMHPNVVHVSPGVMQGQRISGEMPVYPPEAKKKKIQGTVVLEATIGKDGSVEALHVASGPKELQKSSTEAVKTWKYKPFLLNGEPVEVETQINVVYSLDK